MRFADLVRLLGRAKAMELVQAWGGHTIPAPQVASRDARIMDIRAAFKSGSSVEDIMATFNISRSQANAHRAVAYRTN